MFQDNQENRTSLSDLGEFGLIEHLTIDMMLRAL